VICNGESPSKKLAHQLARNVDAIVAADGGANVARKLGIRPDVIIGDLDSITPATERYFSQQLKWLKPLRRFPFSSNLRPKGWGYAQRISVTRQDNTDLEKAFDFLLDHNIRRATIVAATGKRLDHTLGNLSVIWRYTKDIEIDVVGDGFVAIPMTKRNTIATKRGATVSLIPFGVCSGVTLKGLFYPLTNATMEVGTIGLSNIVKQSPFTVEVKEGKMLMIILADYSLVRILS
jgi:thiamine pyrophosphokinase